MSEIKEIWLDRITLFSDSLLPVEKQEQSELKRLNILMRKPPQEGLIILRFDLSIQEEAIKTKCSFIFINFIIAHGFWNLPMKAHYFRVNYYISQSFLKSKYHTCSSLLPSPSIHALQTYTIYGFILTHTHTHRGRGFFFILQMDGGLYGISYRVSSNYKILRRNVS